MPTQDFQENEMFCVCCGYEFFEKQCKDVKTSVAFTAAPADDPVQPVGDEPIPVDIEGILTEVEADRVLPEGTKISLRAEALSLFHQLRHKPKNPYCDTCRRSKLRLARKLTGSFKHDATHWGQHVTGFHMVTLDEMGKGLDGGVDAFVIMDIYSGSPCCISSSRQVGRLNHDGHPDFCWKEAYT